MISSHRQRLHFQGHTKPQSSARKARRHLAVDRGDYQSRAELGQNVRNVSTWIDRSPTLSRRCERRIRVVNVPVRFPVEDMLQKVHKPEHIFCRRLPSCFPKLKRRPATQT